MRKSFLAWVLSLAAVGGVIAGTWLLGGATGAIVGTGAIVIVYAILIFRKRNSVDCLDRPLIRAGAGRDAAHGLETSLVPRPEASTQVPDSVPLDSVHFSVVAPA